MGSAGVADGATARRREQVDRITRTATDLFQRRGYETTSINDVAGALEMSVGGLYRYISTKSDLLELVCEDIYGDLPVTLATIEADGLPPVERLEALLRAYLETCAGNSRLILLMYREYRHLPEPSRARFKAREQAIAEIFARTIVEGIADGGIRDVDADLVAWDVVLLGHLPALKGWWVVGREAEVAGLQRRLLQTLLEG